MFRPNVRNTGHFGSKDRSGADASEGRHDDNLASEWIRCDDLGISQVLNDELRLSI